MVDLDVALRTIREECQKYESCKQCPLRSEGGRTCCITDYGFPSRWKLASDPSDEKDPKRMFV